MPTGHAHAEIAAGTILNPHIAPFRNRWLTAASLVIAQSFPALGLKAGVALRIACAGYARNTFQSPAGAFTCPLITYLSLFRAEPFRIFATQHRGSQTFGHATCQADIRSNLP